MESKDKNPLENPSKGTQPNDASLSPDEIWKDIDAYQKHLELEWESTKKSYQDKIDQIMDDFLKKNGNILEEEIKKDATKKESPADDYKEILKDIQKTLTRNEERNRLLPFPTKASAPIITVFWDKRQLWIKYRRILWTFMLLLGVSYFAWKSYFSIQDMTSLPYTHTSGLLIQDKKVYIADWFRKTLYVHQLKKDLPLISVESIPNQFVTGFVFTNKNLISVDGFEQKLLVHVLTNDHRVLNKFDTPGAAPAGLDWDGTDVWVADNAKHLIFQLHGNELTDIRKQYSFLGLTITAFRIDDHRIWALDGTTRELHILRMQEPLKSLVVYDLDPFLKGGTPTGLHVNKKAIWVTTDNPSTLIRISLKTLNRLHNHKL